MKIGTYYYPEQWPRGQWERDFDNIAGMGLQIVHMAEFAWFAIEPAPGRFEFDWLSDCLNMARRRGLDVILCTPTAAPPVWLSEAHPEILPIDEFGRRARHGGRRHYSPTSPAFREASARIVEAMAARFGDDPIVTGWQIDNEYGAPFDQSPATHAAFRDWLRARYGSIDRLNEAWGNAFWNQYYTDFEQVLFPPSRDPKYANPHHHLDASRFWSSAFAGFNKLQADILKPHVGTRFITTNFMPFHQDCDPMAMADDLTLFSWDAYPVSGMEKSPANEEYRLADPAGLGFVHDQMASYTGRWGLLELQPGHVNWSGIPAAPYPGAVRLWVWTAFAHGAEFVTTYRFRQPRFGVELFHEALVGPDGVTPLPSGRQFTQVIDELRRLDLSKVPPVSKTFDPAITVGLLYDHEQLWYYATLPQAERWSQPQWVRSWYAAVTRLGLNVRVLHPGRPWPAGLRAVVVPGLQMMSGEDAARLDRFAMDGGHLLLTCRTGLMDRRGHLWEGRTAMPILPLIGAEIDGYDGLPAGVVGHVDMNGNKHKWDVWADQLIPKPGTEVLATYSDQFYAGTAAVTRAPRGRGTVTYCGVYGSASLAEALAKMLAESAGLGTTPLPPRVQVVRRGPYTIALNYLTTPIDVPAPEKATFLVGSRTLGPAAVAVWES